MSKALTDALIRNVPPPKTGRLELADSSCRGLWLRITSNGAKTFAFRFRADGRTERLTLGAYPDVTLRDARTRADDLRREVAAGRNPSATKRSASERSFAILAERYLNEHARRFKRSAADDEMNLRLHILPHWANRDYTTIERADVIQLIERIVTAGKPVMANRVQALISGIFSFAVDVDLIKAHPSLKLRKRGQERAKTRVLSDDELRLFWAHAPDSEVGRVLRVILLTGCRPAEVAGMAKAELEFDKAGHPTNWLIPADRSKNGRAHFVPLSPLAAEIIGNSISESDFIFPARRAGSGAIARHSVTGAMKRMTGAFPKDAPGIATWLKDPPTPHDLRRTVATRLAAAGIPGEDVAAVLNHTRSDITGRHYDHYSRAAEKARALARWSQILSAVLTQPAPNIVALGRKGAR